MMSARFSFFHRQEIRQVTSMHKRDVALSDAPVIGPVRRRWRRLMLPLSAILLCLLAAVVANPAVAAEDTIKVGVREVPPFVTRTADGGFDGISIRLWRAIAEDLELDYEFVETDLTGMLDGLRDGRLDAVTAALTVTPEREVFMDFSHPFYSAGLGIAVGQRPATVWQTVGAIFSWQFLQALGALMLVLFAVGVLIWLIERRANPGQFGGRTHQGIGSGFWWSAVTMTTVGYGDKAPITAWGRTVAVVWMFISVITVSGFTAAIASAFTVQQLGSRIQGPGDLPGMRVATVPRSTSAEYLASQRIEAGYYESPKTAIEAVADGRVDAAVYDAPIMRYLASHQHRDRVEVLPQEFAHQDYAIGLVSASQLREPVNQALLRHIGKPVWQETLFQFLGSR